MTLRHQEWAAVVGGNFGKPMGIHQPHTVIHRVDAEAQPGEIQKTHRRHHPHIKPRVGKQSLHDVFEHAW